MKHTASNSRQDQHGHHRHRHETLLTTLQALFGGSVVYRLAAHFLKQPDITAQVERIIPKDKLPLLAAGAVAAAALGIVGQQRNAAAAEKELGRALEEMTAEARDLRHENEELRHDERPEHDRQREDQRREDRRRDDRPRADISSAEHHETVRHSAGHKSRSS